MTTGIAIPPEPQQQRRYVEESAAHGIVGVAIGEQMNAPELSADFLKAADDLDFVVLLTAREVPFIVLSRAFADHGQKAERERLLRSKRLYEAVLRTTLNSNEARDRLQTVGDAIEHDVEIIEVRAESHSRHRAKPNTPVTHYSERRTLELAIPGFPHAVVRMLPLTQNGVPLERGIQQHVSLIAALVLERENTEREKAYRHGTALLSGLVEGRDISDFDLPEHSTAKTDTRNYYLVTGSRVANGVALFQDLLDAGFPCAVYPHREYTHVLIPAEALALTLLQEWMEHLGVSETILATQEARTALGQAQLAHRSASKRDVAVLHFSERTASIIPDTAQASDLLIEQTLGVLIKHDATNGTEYVRSLRIFLQDNRSWSSASERLHIHKQTLIYRMRRVTEMTGLRLDSTQDIAVLWVALEALGTYR